MSVDELRKLNGIGKDFKIIAGQKLKVAAKP
jgi:LysM repeat protein